MADWKNELGEILEKSRERLVTLFTTPIINRWSDLTGDTGEMTNSMYLNPKTKVPREVGMFTKVKAGQDGVPYAEQVQVLDLNRLVKVAETNADDQIKKILAKIISKIQELDSVTRMTTNMQDLSFTLVGERGGKVITLSQSAVFNTSSKGTPFIQFPARFYIDGKAMSEAAYKKMFP